MTILLFLFIKIILLTKHNVVRSSDCDMEKDIIVNRF